ncbi:hypothetical protein PHYPO_G00245130 [Pangasianodon hypophthalmus]|uniref:Uncharacterized protein n=1 Tax=Pangasianodon hypophthalmus TaxID=310915 RepID=A0A5N5NG59_PANHP|nr:hypothetical protein PHYPO_G00245130 [Pangasianodon hypophthalmus]
MATAQTSLRRRSGGYNTEFDKHRNSKNKFRGEKCDEHVKPTAPVEPVSASLPVSESHAISANVTQKARVYSSSPSLPLKTFSRKRWPAEKKENKTELDTTQNKMPGQLLFYSRAGLASVNLTQKCSSTVLLHSSDQGSAAEADRESQQASGEEKQQRQLRLETVILQDTQVDRQAGLQEIILTLAYRTVDRSDESRKDSDSMLQKKTK